MAIQVQELHELIAWAEAAGAPRSLVQDAVHKLADLLDRPEADRRILDTWERGRKIERLRAQGVTPEAIRERTGYSRDQIKRADRIMRVVRDSRTTDLR